MSKDLISRQDALDAFGLSEKTRKYGGDHSGYDTRMLYEIQDVLEGLPSAQPEPEELDFVQPHKKIGVRLEVGQPEIIRCKDCRHKPYPSDNYDYDNGDCGFEIIFPDYRCPCRCDDEYYNRIPDDDWFCGNAERRTDDP